MSNSTELKFGLCTFSVGTAVDEGLIYNGVKLEGRDIVITLVLDEPRLFGNYDIRFPSEKLPR